jgi:hypothetical protein
LPVTRRFKCGRTPSITTAAITGSATIQHTRAIRERTGTCLKQGEFARVSDQRIDNHSTKLNHQGVSSGKRVLPCREGDVHRQALELHELS